jgi:hypothetical protein
MAAEKPKKTTRKPASRAGTKSAPIVADAAVPDESEAQLSVPAARRAKKTTSSRAPEPAVRADAAPAADPADGLDDAIRRTAYEIFLSRGGVGGDEVTDWLEAERIVRSRGSRGGGSGHAHELLQS